MIETILNWLMPDRNTDAASFWCRLGLHKWNPALARCEDCDFPDRILDPSAYRQFREKRQ